MVYNTKIPGYMAEPKLQIIEKLVEKYVPLENGVMVEAGSLVGRTTWCMAKTRPRGHVYAIDLWNGHITGKDDNGNPGINGACTLENFLYWTNDCNNITPLKGRSHVDFINWKEKYPRPNLVFFDGASWTDKSLVWDNLNFWFELINNGGALAGDDFNTMFVDFMKLLTDFARTQHPPKLFKVEHALWVIAKDNERIF